MLPPFVFHKVNTLDDYDVLLKSCWSFQSSSSIMSITEPLLARTIRAPFLGRALGCSDWMKETFLAVKWL